MAISNNTMERAVGRRKTAAARVRVTPGKGVIIVNDRDYKNYFPVKIWQDKVVAPFMAIGKEDAYDVSVKVAGGGLSAQAEAVRHGISRALVKWNPDFKPVLRTGGLLTRDARAKERKKAGLKKARKRTQWRKR
jgi:small subunit ribosomal protein S9